MTDPNDHVELARRLCGAVEAGDTEALRLIYGQYAQLIIYPDARFELEQILGLVQVLSQRIPDLRYADVLCQATETGFVQQHRLSGTGTTGTAFAIPACLVGTVQDGRIVRLEEYVDSVAVQAMGL